MSVDFALGNGWFLEATYWDAVEEKSGQLNAKWKLLKKITPNARLVVVTTPKYESAYRKLLERHIKLHSLDSLQTLLASGVFFRK